MENLPARRDRGTTRITSNTLIPSLAPDPPHRSTRLSGFVWVIRRHVWKILSFVLFCMLLTYIVSKRLTPQYESTAIVDVDQSGLHAVVGQESMQLPLYDTEEFLTTQVKLIQASSVLRPVVTKYHLLDSRRESSRATRVGANHAGPAPVVLDGLQVNRPPNTYLLQISYRSPDPVLSANVANEIANSYIEHTYDVRTRSSSQLSTFMERQLGELKSKMEKSSTALAQFERALDVISPEEKTNILTARLVQINTEYTAAQADRVQKESELEFVAAGSPDAAAVSTQGAEAIQTVSDRLNEASQKFAEVKAKVGPSHPDYQKWQVNVAELQRQLDNTTEKVRNRVDIQYKEAVKRERMLQKELAVTKAEFDRINARSFEYKALQREADADKKLYDELVQKVEEATINAGFKGDKIRLADPALPATTPIFPNVKINLLLAFLLATTLAIGLAILSDMFDNTVRDPEQIRHLFKTDVIGIMPDVPSQELLRMLISDPKPQDNRRVTAYIEAARTLRNSLFISNLDHQPRSLMITSAGPGEGKTTTAVHLAVVHAQQNHRTLLLDADLRRPSIHAHFGLSSTNKGLTDVLIRNNAWQNVIQEIPGFPELHVITAGVPSRKAPDLVGQRLEDLIEEMSNDYNLIIIDSPPMLGFAEPLQMASAVEGVIIVTRAGQTTRTALNSLFGTLNRVRANIAGLVLNRVRKDWKSEYYYYGYGEYGTHSIES